MNLHRIPDGTGRDLKTCLSQCNRATGVEHKARKHRKYPSNDIKKHLHDVNECNEKIISVDFN